jgi:serine/threonine protein kinase/Tol biopolymer transport system component
MDPARWRRLADLYQSALDRDPRERSAFLAQASAGDDELRREVESLLAQGSAPLLIDQPMGDLTAAMFNPPADLPPGTPLGPYRVDHLIGSGGMGQVYRATDTRLNRSVALKVLSRALASDPKFRTRFQREAHVIAALTHPNICTLYDVGHYPATEGGQAVDFLVMEYLEGRSLAARLENGPLPVDQAVTVAIDVADALAAAHRQRIVHRDLKPGNIMLTKGGAKLLDFGLAKLAASLVADGVSRALTAPPGLTAEGTILGTLQYMAPEQLEGRDADSRTDIFAFGAVLYEMLTGKKAFEGKSQANLIGAIMHAQPTPMAASQPLTPKALERIVVTCLEKDPDARWQSARDLSRELRWVAQDATEPHSPVRRAPRQLWTWAVAALFGLVVGGLLVSQFLRDSPEAEAGRQPLRMGISGPGPAMPFVQANNTLALSPDGRTLVLAGGGRLFLRAMDSFALTPIAGSEGGLSPEWSPDGRYIAFLAQGKLKRLDVRSGSVLALTDANPFGAISWAATGTILFPGTTPEGEPAIFKTDPEGRNPTQVLTLDSGRGEVGHSWPHFLPDGRRFLYVTLITDTPTRSIVPVLRTMSLDGGGHADVGQIASRAMFDRAGYLVYGRDGALVAQPFDPSALTLSGERVVLVERFYYFRSTGLADFAISQAGTLAFRTPPPPARLVWLDRQGIEIGRLGEEALYGEPRISADGSRVAVDIRDPALGTGDLWMFDRALGTSVRVTHSPADERVPVWSPDGSTLYFSSDAAGPPDLYRRFLDTGREELLVRTPGVDTPNDVSADGRELLFHMANREASGDLWRLRLARSAPIEEVQRSPAGESSGRFSPDGRWMAYDSNESGRFETYIQSVDNPGVRWKVSLDGGVNPEWGAGGAELFFVGTGPRLLLMSAPIRTTPSFQPGTPRPLFPMSSALYSVLPTDSRFLVVEPGRAAASPINAIVNWRALAARSKP